MVPMVDTNFWHRLSDLHLSKLIMTVLIFRNVSKFSHVKTADTVGLPKGKESNFLEEREPLKIMMALANTKYPYNYRILVMAVWKGLHFLCILLLTRLTLTLFGPRFFFFPTLEDRGGAK